MIAYIIPTRNRANELRATVASLQRLGEHAEVGGAEIIVADNASEPAVGVPARGPLPVRIVRLPENRGAAARNDAAELADGRAEWLVMLDDDSAPLDTGWLRTLDKAPLDVGAITADIVLPDGSRERGGLPEVPVGCGVAVRADLFRAVGGYDASFDYYAEEYDLAARLLLTGHRVVFEPAFRVLHRKAAANRDFGRILQRLVRNNAWVIQRYAPEVEREPAMMAMLTRYAQIADLEGVRTAFNAARRELDGSLRRQPRRAMDRGLWERFTGLHHARQSARRLFEAGFGSASLVARGKHAELIVRALSEAGIEPLAEERPNAALMIGTLSPGPMLDAMAQLGADPRVVAPWDEAEAFRAGRSFRAAG